MFSEPAKNIARFGLTHGMKVVDIGSGSGYYTLEAARIVGLDGRVYSVDVQKQLLDRVKKNANAEGLRNVEIVWGNAEKIGGTKLREGIADRVVASNVLFQMEKPNDFALEIKRLLKPGGKLLLIDWSEASPMSPKNIVNEPKAKLLFEKSGFKFEESFGAGEHHYALIFIRE